MMPFRSDYRRWLGPQSEHALPISADLPAGLRAWSGEMGTIMWGPNGPDAPGWDGPEPAFRKVLNDQGSHLVARVRAVLDETWEVVHFDEIKDDLVVVDPPVPPST